VKAHHTLVMGLQYCLSCQDVILGQHVSIYATLGLGKTLSAMIGNINLVLFCCRGNGGLDIPL
jgi:hypothetical protein